MLCINQVNYATEGGRLTPTLVAPVAAAIGEHSGEVTDKSNARPGKDGTGVSVGPCVTAIGRSEDQVVVVVEKATAAFIHASYINITRGEITRDLDVANKRCACRNLSLVGPRRSVVSGEANENARAASKVVP
jgi:hypothetical protein